MTFDQIQYFIAIVEQNTYFDDAEELNISQSALSKQIIKLEKELGVTLLDRSRRKASLTPAGETFYQDALVLRRQYESMTEHLKKYQIFTGNKNELRVGTLPILTQYGLTAHFRQFTKSHPDIHLILDEVEENDLKKGLLSGQYDLIICREQMIDDQSSISSVYLADDELVTVLPVGHPLDGSVSLSALADESFILMNRYTSVYQICQELFANVQIHPQILRTGRVESIISAVAIGEGVSLLPYSNFKLFHHEHVKTLPLTPPVKLPVVIAGTKKRMNSSICQEFIRCMTAYTSYPDL